MKKLPVVSSALASLLAVLPAAADPVSPPTARFAPDPIQYDVPLSGSDGGFYSTTMAYTNKHWTLYDMNGDGKPDIVQTRDPFHNSIFGAALKNEHWRVYMGTPTGYDRHINNTWNVPSSGTEGGFRDFGAGETVRYWSVLNFENKNQPALLQTVDPDTGKVWKSNNGKPYWKMFRVDSNARWNKTAVMVMLGDSGKDKGFYSIASGWNTEHWTVLDIDGDGRLDLVQTANPATGKVWHEGASRKYWRVYYNQQGMNGGILLDTPTQWEVPDLGASYPNGFNSVALNDNTKQWVTFDIDGDGKPELVHTADPATGKVWGHGTPNTYWRVYKRDGSNYGYSKTPILWPVPDSGTSQGFDAATSGGSGKNWVTLDLDGDGKPDLVQTTAPGENKVWGAGSATPYWKLYKNTGSGFAKTAITFNVPLNGTDAGFFSITSASGKSFWTLVDIDGDKRLDLVLTADPTTGDVWPKMAPADRMSTGQATGIVKMGYWRVFRGMP